MRDKASCPIPAADKNLKANFDGSTCEQFGNQDLGGIRMQSRPLVHDGKTHVPVPSGRYVVGCTDLMKGPDIENGCFFRLYYPTDLEDIYEKSSCWPEWIPHPKYIDGYTSTQWLRNIPYLGRKLVGWNLGNVYVPIVFDAKPKATQKFPVIVFSHGLTACRTAYSVICSELASHGFIVAATEHRDTSACISFNLVKNCDGQYVEEWVNFDTEKFETTDLPLRKRQLPIRIHDCQHTLDVLMQLNDGRTIDHLTLSTLDVSLFKGLMDLSNPVLAGQSFGGATVLRTLAVDKRFKIGMALDAWMWPLQDEEDLPKQIDQPILFINTHTFQTSTTLKNMKRFTVDVQVERRVVTIKGSQHLNQVDLPLFLPSYLRPFAGAYSSINPFLAMELNNRLMLLFLSKHLDQQSVDARDEHEKFVGKHGELLFEGVKA